MISVSCPSSIRNCAAALSMDELAAITIDGALLNIVVAGDTLEERYESLDAMDAYVGGLIADANDPVEVASLGDLKLAISGARTVITRESSYSDAMQLPVTEEATTDDAVSHLHATSNASSEGASEQQGAVPQNEEKKIVEAQQEEPVAPVGRRGDRK